MRMKKLLSVLLACSILIGLIPMVSLAADNNNAAPGYHVFTDLPSGTVGTATTATLYFGAPVNGVFYGLNSNKQTGWFFSSTSTVSSQYTMKIRYAGNDATYGDYYNLIFTNTGGSSYVIAYDSTNGGFAQNLLTNGAPSGGFAYKHRLYWDAENQIFYHRLNSNKNTTKGLKVSKESKRFFIESLANLQAAGESTGYTPARIYEMCKSDNVAGSDSTHTWSGSCSCGYKFDYQEKTVEVYLGYHPVTQLPTAENPVVTGDLRLGAAIGNEFYGLSGMSSVPENSTTRFFPGSGEDDEMCTISVQYGGTHETYGEYYYVIFTLKNGKSYALSYASGFVAQNQILDNGEPTDGWQDKNRMYFDQQSQTFYRAFESEGNTITKGLKISTTSHNIFTEQLSNLQVENSAYAPLRMYARCATEGPADRDSDYHWDGLCSCGAKVGYGPHDTLTEWNEKTPEGHSKVCSCGLVMEELKPHEMPADWTVADNGLVYRLCTACGYRELKDHDTHQYTVPQFNGEAHWMECICGEKTEAVAHTMSQWSWDVKPTILAETGVEKRTCSGCEYIETRENTLSALSFVASANPPAANVPFYLGATQMQMENTPTYYFKGEWSPNKYQSMDTTKDMYSAKEMYAEEAGGGYKLYFNKDGAKIYLNLSQQIVAGEDGVFVQPTTDVNAASVFKWNNQYATFQTEVEGKGDYYMGLYTATKSNGDVTHYTKLQALMVSGLGREDRHPAKIYMNTEAADHTHSFSQWQVLSVPTHLQDQGKEKRSCSICGCEEIRITTLNAEDFVASANPPGANVPFYLGSTQMQVEGTPTYFFKGGWAANTYQNMDTTKDIYAAEAMYAEEVGNGFRLYFFHNDAKVYLYIDSMTISGTDGVFVQPTTDVNVASVFMWNNQFATFQTEVADLGDYYIGLYTNTNKKGEVTRYTKLQALMASGLGREDRHPAKIYMSTRAADHEHNFSAWQVLSVPTHLQEQGKEKRSCSICGVEEIRIITLREEDFVISKTNPPASNVPFYLGATQRQIEGKPTYYFSGEWAPNTYQNMATSTKKENAAAMYVEPVNGGYKLYFFNSEGTKTYLILDKMTVSKKEGVYVQPTTDVKKASVFLWNEEYATFYTNVVTKGDYYIGLYTSDGGTKFTKLQALLVTGLGRNDRHPAAVYLRNYDVEGHTHTFGKWERKSSPTHLNDQGSQERVCSTCGYIQARIVMYTEKDYKVATSAPASGKTFYLGATQLQMENHPTYYFLGEWLPRKFQRLDVTAEMKKSQLMYTEKVDGGYRLYFLDDGVKTYLTIESRYVQGDRNIFVQPAYDPGEAAVFTWNEDVCTFQTTVKGKDDYCIGNYSIGDLNYTKLSAIKVTDLTSEQFHAAAIYVLK